MTDNIVTSDLSEFGYMELAMLTDLIDAMMENGLPDDFYNDEVVPCMNKSSGCVFLTNSDCQVAMLNNKRELESFYFLSYHGNEGFLDDLLIDFNNGNIGKEDYEQLADICEINGRADEAKRIKEAIQE